MNWYGIAHLLIVLTWVGGLVAGGIGLTMLGSQEHRIATRRGAIERDQAIVERDLQEVGAALELETSKPRIAEAVRLLELPLRRELEVARR